MTRRPFAAVLLAIGATVGADGSGAAAGEKPMSGARIKAVIDDHSRIALGGPGEGYSGTLVFNKDGTAAGKVTPDGGSAITITGTWTIKKNQFCRTWTEIDPGREVCEDWVPSGSRQAEVMVKGKRSGLNSW